MKNASIKTADRNKDVKKDKMAGVNIGYLVEQWRDSSLRQDLFKLLEVPILAVLL